MPAGFPSPAQDHLEQTISLDDLLNLHAPQTYLVRADGDSMLGEGIFSGDLLVVDRSVTARPGDIVIAALNCEPLVKRLCRDGAQCVLRSANPAYPPRYILEGDDLQIWGVVLHSIRRHERA
ncbi:LexA family protein [Aquipseudomonas campi]